MGCDIHSIAQQKTDGKWKDIGYDVFNYQSYGLFGFLANVRNYSEVPFISEPRGFPRDYADKPNPEFSGGFSLFREPDHTRGFGDWHHSQSHVKLRELLNFDYDQLFFFWDRRVTKRTGPNSSTGAGRAEEDEGERITIREFLGKAYFNILDELKAELHDGEIRIVFWFDN